MKLKIQENGVKLDRSLVAFNNGGVIVVRWYEDALSMKERDPAAKSVWQVILLYPGFKALFHYRIAHWFYKHKRYFIARAISQLSRFFTGIEIHPGAKIGRGLFIDHGMGIVIGETAEIGDNCTIYHGVTLGGTGKDIGKRHPTIGNNVLISTGAKVLGPFKVGDNARIGANSVVLCEVEPNTTVVGVPGRAVKKGDKKIRQSFELDQIHTGDPVSQEICKLNIQLDKLKKELFEYEQNYANCMARKTIDINNIEDIRE